ncbi:MAG: iron-containing alcohol dehydrogenase [Myxococcaceae bacterium]|nr:iron-containing alcohol dehydrogenase [Myxococcaceae bacterium]
MIVEVAHRFVGPARVAYGEGLVETALGQALGERAKILLVTTASATKDPRLLARVRSALEGRAVRVVDSVSQHVPVEALDQLTASPFDAVVSLGGGSPIDAAKVAVVLQATGTRPTALASTRLPESLGPRPLHVALPTTLSGAELSPTAGFTVEGRKVGVFHSELSPQVVLGDVALAQRTPLTLWLSTGVRSIDHAIEGLLAAGQHPLAQAAARDGLPALIDALSRTAGVQEDAQARHDAQVAAFLCYQLPLEAQRGPSHALGKRLGASFGIPHGLTSCLTLPAVLAVRPRDAALARLEALLHGPPHEVVRALLQRLGLVRRLSDFGVGPAERARVEADFTHPELSKAHLHMVLETIA